MTSMPQLHVVTAYFNPLRLKSRRRLYDLFEAHMLASGVALTTVECAFGERPYELSAKPGVQHVPARARTMLWTKENLLNLGVQRLAPDWRYVAFIDADLTFRRLDWASETVHALQHYDFVWPWSDCYDLGPNGEHVDLHRSFGRIWWERKPILPGAKCAAGGYQFAHPGYALATTRQALEWVGGLIETAALGAADYHMAMALIGRVEDSIHGGVTAGYRRPLLAWQARANHHIKGNVSYVPGTIEHGWHGPKAARNYVGRWDVLVRNAFDPDSDLKRNTSGVLELAGNKPGLAHDLDAYFRARDEDSKSLT